MIDCFKPTNRSSILRPYSIVKTMSLKTVFNKFSIWYFTLQKSRKISYYRFSVFLCTIYPLLLQSFICYFRFFFFFSFFQPSASPKPVKAWQRKVKKSKGPKKVVKKQPVKKKKKEDEVKAYFLFQNSFFRFFLSILIFPWEKIFEIE